MSTGDRGKSAESKVRAALLKLSAQVGAVFYRLPDARSGSFQVTLADFLAVLWGVPALIEVKEVAHAYRLSYNNFNSSQVARQRLWKLAGAEGWVLVYHSTTGLWRCLDIEVFTDRSVGGSWDLRPYPAGSLIEVMLCQLKLRFPGQVQSLESGLSC